MADYEVTPVSMVFREQGACFSMQGCVGDRLYMEDSAMVYNGEKELNAPNIFGVFDGHGGVIAAEFCRDRMGEAIATHPRLKTRPKAAITEAFLKLNDLYASEAKRGIDDLSDGTTATVLYVAPDDEHSSKRHEQVRFWLACAGDSRAILVKRDGTAIQLSTDHNCRDKDELTRIIRAGGEIVEDDEHQPRVYADGVGGLAVTRSIGDIEFKPYVTAEPEFYEGVLNKECSYVVLATDGLWESLSNEDVAQVLQNRPGDLASRVEYLIGVAKERDNWHTRNEFNGASCDNITMLAIEVKPLVIELLKYQKRMDKEKERELAAVEASKGDELFPGVSRSGYIAEILLWKIPIRTSLWFMIGCLLFYLNSFVGFTLLTIVSYLMLVQLCVTTFIVKAAPFLIMIRMIDREFETTAFVNEGTFFTPASVAGASKVVLAACSFEFERWRQIVYNGSAKRVLIALRNVSYFFTPVETGTLMFITFLGLFSLPVIYDRNKMYIDKSMTRFWTNADLFKRSLGRRVSGKE